MNDLVEKALHGLDVAQREVRARPMPTFGVLGFAVACVVVVTGGRVAAASPTHPLTTWFGLESSHGVPRGSAVPGAVFLVAVAALVLLWAGIVAVVRRGGQRPSRIWWVAGAWALPFAVGPPLLDTSVYSYAAFGLLQRDGHSPYSFGAARLGDVPIVAAIDPGSRGTPAGVGPLGTLVQHLAVSVSAGSALGAVIVLRVVAVLSAVAIGRYAADLAGRRRARALTLTILNPLLLLYVVSAAHLDGLMIALVLAALTAANRRRWLRSIVLACIAGSVSGQAFVVLPAIVAAHWLGRRTVAPWRLLGRDTVVAAATTAVCGLVVPDGFGWLWTVGKQFSTHTPFSVAGATAEVIGPIVRGASYDDLAAGARLTAITAMVCTIGYLAVTARQRTPTRTAGYCLLAMGLLAPALYPWYLLWGLLCLAPTADRPRRLTVLFLTATGCALVPAGFGATSADIATGAWLAVVAAGLGAVLAVQRRAATAPAEPRPEAEPISAGS